MKLKSNQVRWVSFFIATIFAMPLSLGIATGFYLWLSPYILLNSVIALHQFVFLHILGFVVLLVAVFKHRWFCHWMCPTGALCDAVSKRGIKKNRLNKIPSMHKTICIVAIVLAGFGVPVLIVADPVNLFYAFFDGFQSLPIYTLLLKLSGLGIVLFISYLIPHMWCQRLCPLGGLQDLVFDFERWIFASKLSTSLKYDNKRRLCLTGIVVVGSTLFIQKLAQARSEPIIRPPGAQAESLFKMLCSRCGNCVKVCPTQIIIPTFRIDDLVGALTPGIRFNDQYCREDCILCGSVCPSGAIDVFSLEDKRQLVMGVAHINRTDCLLSHHEECDLCKVYCPYDAIEIKESDFDFSAYPEVFQSKCVGCGACEVICPAEVITVKIG